MRLGLWESAWGLFLKNPFLGTGLGTFGETYQMAGLDPSTGSRYAHHLLLQLLVETGLVGTGLFLAALAGFLRRLRTPSRWEGWGILTGTLSILLFSLIDLPFQMPELVWIFLGTAGLLELRPPGKGDLETLPEGLRQGPPRSLPRLLEAVLLAVLFVSGFWPPFQPWNIALLAAALWGLFGFLGTGTGRIPFWIVLGGGFLVLRAFFSPSAPGTVRFLETAGLALVFALLIPAFRGGAPVFLRAFLALGLGWAVKVWWIPFHYAGTEPGAWWNFQYSDVKDWMIFPNPKQVGIVLALMILLYWEAPFRWIKAALIAAAFLTILRLKALAAGVALVAGATVKFLGSTGGRRFRVLAVLALVLGTGLFLRSQDPSPTRWGRLEIWASALKVWSAAPVLGRGPGAFAGEYHRVKAPREEGASRYLMEARFAHNEFLDLLAGLGLVGVLFLVLGVRRSWKGVREEGRRRALAGAGTASLFDFILHTPLLALQTAGLAAPSEPRKAFPSGSGGFLALGLSFCLFGSAAFAHLALAKAQDLEEKGIYRGALQRYRSACGLNAWDPGIQKARGEFLEKLYRATGDERWARLAQGAFQQAMDLDRSDGHLRFGQARRLTQRMALKADPDDMARAAQAWIVAREALPLDAFVRFEEAFFLRAFPGREEGLPGAQARERAVKGLRAAVGLEPNFAPAWFQLGLWLREDGREDEAVTCFKRALGIHRKFMGADRIDPLEERLVGLTPERVTFLEKGERSWSRP
jgi:O-antigen ligase